MKLLRLFLLLLVALSITTANAAPAGPEAPFDSEAVAAALGRSGKWLDGGVYKVSFPRADLNVTIGGLRLRPGFALGSYLAFKPYAGGALVMGDLVLLEGEVGAVMRRLAEGGIAVTAVHNHLLTETPHVVYVHFMGIGKPAGLALQLKSALAATATPLGAAPTPAAQAQPWFEEPVESALGRKGNFSGGVLSVSVPRAFDETINGITIPASMGTWEVFNFQDAGSGEVASTGDFALTADEVGPVLRALQDSGIDVEALHSHMLDDVPHLFYAHFWAVGDPQKIARGLRGALEFVKTK